MMASNPPPNTTMAAIRAAVGSYYGEMEHPLVAGMKVKDYPVYERVASMLFSDNLQAQPPTPSHVEHAFLTLEHSGLSPSEFEHTWELARPVANRLLDRDPSITEVARLKDAHPRDVHSYYSDHPYPGYEEVTAGQFIKAWRSAEPIARYHGKELSHEAVSRFAVSGYNAEDMHRYFEEEW